MTIKHTGGIFGRNPTFNNVTIDGGAFIGGTAAGNKLDDYEEGTWTPTVTGATSGSATVTTTAHANYTKIGNMVIARCYIVVDFSSHTVSGDVQIGGLPFSAATNNEQMSTITFCNWLTADETDITLSARIVTANAKLLKGSSSTAITNSDLISSSGGTIMFGLIYKA